MGIKKKAMIGACAILLNGCSIEGYAINNSVSACATRGGLAHISVGFLWKDSAACANGARVSGISDRPD